MAKFGRAAECQTMGITTTTSWAWVGDGREGGEKEGGLLLAVIAVARSVAMENWTCIGGECLVTILYTQFRPVSVEVGSGKL